MVQKLQIYFQPAKPVDGIESFTLSLSRFDKEENRYRRKLTLEKDGNKYKIKEYFNELDKLLKILDLISFEDYPREKQENGKDLYYVRYMDNCTQTTDKAKIQDLLDLFEFEEAMATDISKYELDD